MKWIACAIFLAHFVVAGAPPKTRVAHIGLELDGSWSWIREVSLNPTAELIAIAEPHEEFHERAHQAAPGARLFPDYRTMLDQAKPEAVTVTVPNSRHLEVVRECAKRRIHVWFQKPMAATAKDAREMDRLAREAGITLMINYHPLWSAPMRALQGKVDSGEIGSIRHVEVRHAFAVSKVLSPSYLAQFLDPSQHGGGALMDQGTYGIDYVVWLLGRPLRVYASAKTLRPRPGLKMEDDVWVTLDYPGATAVVHGGWWSEPDGPGMGFTRVSGTKGEVVRDLNSVVYTAASSSSKTAPQPVSLPDVAADQRGGIAHFLDCVRAKKPVDAPHSSALNVIVNEIVDAAYESIRSGQAVSMRK